MQLSTLVSSILVSTAAAGGFELVSPCDEKYGVCLSLQEFTSKPAVYKQWSYGPRPECYKEGTSCYLFQNKCTGNNGSCFRKGVNFPALTNYDKSNFKCDTTNRECYVLKKN